MKGTELHRNIPNIITLFRIIGSILLLFVMYPSNLFLCLYIQCGLSDILDGWVSRRWSLQSRFGAKLDSIADFLFIGVVLLKTLPSFHLSNRILFWIIGIACVRITSMILMFYRFHVVAGLHTYANKITGFTLFMAPLFLSVINHVTLGTLLCIIASISGVEEFILVCTLKELDLNTKRLETRK